MKIAIIQPPYPKKLEYAQSAFDFILNELHNIKEADLVLIPEYSNAPGPQTLETLKTQGYENFRLELEEAKTAAKRLGALVAFNAGVDEGMGLRNTTYLVNKDGELIHRYFKLHLPVLEKDVLGLDFSYGNDPSGCVYRDEGLTIGFMTCYDAYFAEQVEYLADAAPDIILLASYQRSEDSELLAAQVRLMSLRTGAAVIRSSWSMGADAKTGGTSMAVNRNAEVVAEMFQRIGTLYAEIDLSAVPYRSNGFGMPQVESRLFISNGRNREAFGKL